MQSSQASAVYEMLLKIFPLCNIVKEHSIRYKGQQLYFDFYIKDYDIVIEIQGRQHYEFVKHFHGDSHGFIKSKNRDNLKIAYCDENNFTLIVIDYNEKIKTEKDLIEKIYGVMING